VWRPGRSKEAPLQHVPAADPEEGCQHGLMARQPDVIPTSPVVQQPSAPSGFLRSHAVTRNDIGGVGGGRGRAVLDAPGVDD